MYSLCTFKDSRGGKEKHQNTHDQYDNNHLMNDSLWVHQYVLFFFVQVSLPFLPANEEFDFRFGLGCLCLLFAVLHEMMTETNRKPG